MLDTSQHSLARTTERGRGNQTEKNDNIRDWIREFVGFEPGFVDSNLDSWIRTWIRGFELGFVDSNLDSWIRTWIRGFELGFVDSNLDSWIRSWIRGFEIGFQLTVYEIRSVSDPSSFLYLLGLEHQSSAMEGAVMHIDTSWISAAR